LKKVLEKLLLKNRRLYRFIAGVQKHTNADKYVFSHYIKRGDTVIDCGANIGYYTNFFRTIVGKKGCVHAFEPVPSTFEHLTKNALEYSKYNNYRLNNSGLYRIETIKNIYIPDSISGHASLNNHQDVWNAQKIDNIEIKLIRLDDYIDKLDINKVDFIKIDIEGSEMDALYGSKNTLQKNKPKLHLEVNSDLLHDSQYAVQELWELLKGLDYRKIYYYDNDPKLLLDFESLKNHKDAINTNVIAIN